MTTLAATSLEKLIAWIDEKEGDQVGVAELYGDGPAQVGLTEMELRECVIDGVNRRVLAIGGLTGVIQLKRAEHVAKP